MPRTVDYHLHYGYHDADKQQGKYNTGGDKYANATLFEIPFPVFTALHP